MVLPTQHDRVPHVVYGYQWFIFQKASVPVDVEGFRQRLELVVIDNLCELIRGEEVVDLKVPRRRIPADPALPEAILLEALLGLSKGGTLLSGRPPRNNDGLFELAVFLLDGENVARTITPPRP